MTDVPSVGLSTPCVVLELVSAGVPVIVIPGTSYSGSVRDGIEGSLGPMRESQAIDRVTARARDAERRPAVGWAARARAGQLTRRAFEQTAVSELERSPPDEDAR